MEPIVFWIAPVATTIAALMTASNLGSRITGYGFAVFLVGSIAWTGLGILTDQPNLIWQNAILSILNAFGIWRWLGRQSRIEEGGHAAAEASATLPGEELFPVSLLARAPLEGRNEKPIGHCVDAMAGCSSGRIHYLVASEGGVAGVGETLRRVPWRYLRIDGERICTGLDQHTFDHLESIDREQWPGR